MSNLLTNLVAYYKFDESSGNPVDASGNGFTLTNNNTVGFSAGKINNGADFGGSNTNKDFTIPTGMTNFGKATPASFSYWIKTSDTSTFVSTRCNGSAFAQWNIMTLSGKPYYEYSPANSGANQLTATASNTLNDGNWHHVLITYSGNLHPSGVKFYIDGVQSTTVSGADTLSTDAPTSIGGAIGSRTSAFGSYMSGMLDEFGIWNVELTAADAVSLYNGGAGFPYPFAANIPNKQRFVRQAVNRASTY